MENKLYNLIKENGQLEVQNNKDLYEIQNTEYFENCKLDYYDDIECNPKDLKSFFLTTDLRLLGKGYIKSISLSPTMHEFGLNDISNRIFKSFKCIIICGIFDSIQYKNMDRIKFYLDEN